MDQIVKWVMVFWKFLLNVFTVLDDGYDVYVLCLAYVVYSVKIQICMWCVFVCVVCVGVCWCVCRCVLVYVITHLNEINNCHSHIIDSIIDMINMQTAITERNTKFKPR